MEAGPARSTGGGPAGTGGGIAHATDRQSLDPAVRVRGSCDNRIVPTVLLLGYSCAGKSTIVREVRDRWPEVEGLDSDDWVAEPYGAHIYEVFFRLGRLAALDQVAYARDSSSTRLSR